MTIPLPCFTKTKWLAFFAELTAKITHHNVMVVLEGCEMVKRLLVSSVSVAAFLEEGDLLTHLLDTIAGDMLTNERRETGVPSLALAEKLLFTQLETLSLIIDMMVALYADKDAYYGLLVQARAGVILATLVALLQRQHPRFFGIIATMTEALLSLPLGRGVPVELQGDLAGNVALTRHVQQLRSLVAQHRGILREATETLRALALAAELPVRLCSAALLRQAARRLRRARRVENVNNSGGNSNHHNSSVSHTNHTAREDFLDSRLIGLNRSEPQMDTVAPAASAGTGVSTHSAVDATVMSINDSNENTEVDEATASSVPDEECEACFARLAACRSHDEFFVIMNRLWCLTVADGVKIQHYFSGIQFEKTFARFLKTMPSNQQDEMLFTSVLLWLSHMMSSHQLRADTRDSILSVAGVGLIQIVVQDLRRRDVLGTRDEQDVSSIQAASTQLTNSAFVSRADCLVVLPLHSQDQSSPSQGLVERPSIPFVVLSFLLVAEGACGPQQMEQWIRQANLFVLIEALMRGVEQYKSVLLSTSTTMDGSVSDEVYLSCAMNSARTEHLTLAALACKLFASIIWNHYAVLTRLLASETATMLQTVIPLLLKIGINNPTLTSAVENVTGSALHHSPNCQRSSRFTTLGECSLVALDGCFWFMTATRLEVVQLSTIISSLSSLLRVTQNSIHPPLRATVYRCLARLCPTLTELTLVLREMPSALNAAVTSVLSYGPTVPQWEAAAAAEWLAHVVHIAAQDPVLEERFNFTGTALPVRLLELAASNGITYATASLLSLVNDLFEQQQHFSHMGDNETSSSVLLPYGRRSVDCWISLIQTSTQNNEKLTHVCEMAMPATTITAKDALSRSLSSVEGIAVQYTFVCSLTRGLLYLLKAHAEHCNCLNHEIIWNLISSTLALPAPDVVFDMLAVRFGLRLKHHTALERSYGSMLQWSIELCVVWFTSSRNGGGGGDGDTLGNNSSPNGCVNSKDAVSFSPAFFSSCARIMRNGHTSHRTRAYVASLVSSLLSLPSPLLREALATASGELFTASLDLKAVPCVSGMQCRLVSFFEAAVTIAQTSGWFKARLLDLEQGVAALKQAGGVLASVSSNSKIHGNENVPDNAHPLLTTLSLAVSVPANPVCRDLSREVIHPLSVALRQLLGFESTRRAAMRAAQALAGSPEGRNCLLHEVTSTGEPLGRTCFGRILQLTLTVALEKEQLQLQLQRANDMAMRRTPIAEREAMRMVVATIGFDVCATACGRGGEPFVHSVLKLKGVEQIEGLLIKCERERTPMPLGLFRLVAAISFQSEAQMAIMRQSELMTILIEAANTNTTSSGTLALLVLRNLCFHPGLKTQLCQDSRVLRTFKASLTAQPNMQQPLHDNMSSEARESTWTVLSIKAGEGETRRLPLQHFTNQATGVSPPQLQKHKQKQQGAQRNKVDGPTATAQGDVMETLRRQELAVTAFWSLMYDNQRSKSYVRGILNQTPAVNMNKLVLSSEQLPMGTLSIEQYPEKMSEAIEHIKLLGVGSHKEEEEGRWALQQKEA